MARRKVQRVALGPDGKELPIEGITADVLAQRVGCSPTIVARAIRRGVLFPLENGRMAESAIEALREHIQEAEADDEGMLALKKRAMTAEANERELKVQLRQFQLERESGKYLERTDVIRSGADAASRMTAIARAVPSRVAMEVEGAQTVPQARRAAVIEKIIRAEIERMIGEMRDALSELAASGPAAAQVSPRENKTGLIDEGDELI